MEDAFSNKKEINEKVCRTFVATAYQLNVLYVDVIHVNE